MNSEVANKAFPWKRVLAVVVSIGAMAFVFRRIDAKGLGQAFLKTHPGWYLAAVLSFGFAILCAAWRWHLMLRLTGAGVHVLAALRVYCIGHGLGMVLLGPAGGDIAKSALYARWYGQSMPRIYASTPLDRLLGLAGMAAFCVPAFLLAAVKGVFKQGEGMKFHLPLPLVLAGIVAGVGGLIFILRFRVKSESGPARFFNAFADGFRQVLTSPGLAATGLTLGFLVQAASCAVFAFSLKAVVSVDCPWLDMLWVFPVIGAMSAVPSVGGLGVREGVSIVLLKLYGVPETDAVAASLLGTGTTLFWAAVGGLLLWNEERQYETKAATGDVKAVQSISVIVTGGGSREAIEATVTSARNVPEVGEVIVLNSDAKEPLSTVAEKAAGEAVIFLKGGLELPVNAGEAVTRCLGDRSVAGGGFWFSGGNGARLSGVVRLVFLRDVKAEQGIFARRTALNGLAAQADLGKQIRNHGRLALADAVVRVRKA